jgi:hypothetical protein
VSTNAARMRLHRLEALGLLKFEKPISYLDGLAQTILYSNPDDTFRGRAQGYLVGPYGVVAICEALDKAGFEIAPKQEAQPSGLGFCRSAAVAMKRVTSRPLRCDIRPRHTVTRCACGP